MSDTQTGYIQAKQRNQANTQWRIQIGGKWYGADRAANIDGCEQGSFVEYQLGGFNNRNTGQWVSTIARIRPASPPQAGYPASQPQGGQNAANSPPATPPARLASAHWDDSALRFISNVVGCAIAAGKAADPVDVIAWARSAELALMELNGKVPAVSGTNVREPGQDDGFDDSAELEQMASAAQASRNSGNW